MGGSAFRCLFLDKHHPSVAPAEPFGWLLFNLKQWTDPSLTKTKKTTPRPQNKTTKTTNKQNHQSTEILGLLSAFNSLAPSAVRVLNYCAITTGCERTGKGTQKYLGMSYWVRGTENPWYRKTTWDSIHSAIQCTPSYIYLLHIFTWLAFSFLRATDLNMATFAANVQRLYVAQLQLKAVGTTQWTLSNFFGKSRGRNDLPWLFVLG